MMISPPLACSSIGARPGGDGIERGRSVQGPGSGKGPWMAPRNPVGEDGPTGASGGRRRRLDTRTRPAIPRGEIGTSPPKPPARACLTRRKERDDEAERGPGVDPDRQLCAPPPAGPGRWRGATGALGEEFGANAVWIVAALIAAGSES